MRRRKVGLEYSILWRPVAEYRLCPQDFVNKIREVLNTSKDKRLPSREHFLEKSTLTTASTDY